MRWVRGMYVCSGGEEKKREKNEMGEEGCMCVVWEKKKERQGGTWVGGPGGRGKEGNKKEKRNGE
jgi:hypothetical protein